MAQCATHISLSNVTLNSKFILLAKSSFLAKIFASFVSIEYLISLEQILELPGKCNGLSSPPHTNYQCKKMYQVINSLIS